MKYFYFFSKYFNKKQYKLRILEKAFKNTYIKIHFLYKEKNVNFIYVKLSN